jgi:HSP20 family protein
MQTTRWQPFADVRSEMSRLRHDLERVFGRYENGGPAAAGGYPLLNLWEDEDNLWIEAELPGMELDTMEILVTGGNRLSIKGERRPPTVEKGAWHRQERGYGAFTRVVDLPCPVNDEGVRAEFKQGVLTIALPKSPQAKPRRIEVKGE